MAQCAFLPYTVRALIPPPQPPADKPPVPCNQVSSLLCAPSAELNQLPLMACGSPPLPGSRGGGGKVRNEP